MSTVGVYEAKTHLSRPLKQVEAGEEVVIERGGTPVADRPDRTSTPRFRSVRGTLHRARRLRRPAATGDSEVLRVWFLLDTHVWLWLPAGSPRLSPVVSETLVTADPQLQQYDIDVLPA